MVKINPDFETIKETNILRARAYLGETIESSVLVANRWGGSLHLYWVDHNGVKCKLATLENGADQTLKSYVNNEFEVQQLGDCELEVDPARACRTARFKNHGGDPSESCTGIVATYYHRILYVALFFFVSSMCRNLSLHFSFIFLP